MRQTPKPIRTADQERTLEAAVRHLESVHRLIVLRRAGAKVLPFPVRPQ